MQHETKSSIEVSKTARNTCVKYSLRRRLRC